MNKPMRIALYVIFALLSGYGLIQFGYGGMNVYTNYTFLNNARLLDEYRAAKAKQEAAAKPAPKPTQAPVVEAVP